MQDKEYIDLTRAAVKRAGQIAIETARATGTKVAIMVDGKPALVDPDELEKEGENNDSSKA